MLVSGVGTFMEFVYIYMLVSGRLWRILIWITLMCNILCNNCEMKRISCVRKRLLLKIGI